MTHSSDRLLHYLSQAYNASPQTAAELCVSATADPQLYEFNELLHTPSIASLRNTPNHSSYELLRLFAHGTIADYTPSSFPPLTPAHLRKLRTLTLVSLANGTNVLKYHDLKTHLQLPTVRELEDVVLDAINHDLLRARMDQRAGRVEIISAVGRDVVTPAGIGEMATMLKKWTERSSQLISQIDERLEFIKQHTDSAAEARKTQEANILAAKQMIQSDEWLPERH